MRAGSQRRAATSAGGGVRERLITAAAQLIAEGGTTVATSRSITERAGENLASITYYFGSRDVLLSEALVREARTLLRPVLDLLEGADEPAGRLLAAVELLVRIVKERTDRLAAYADCLAHAARDDRVADEVRALLRELQSHLADEMDRQREDERIPHWVDPTAMASLMVALANGVAVGIAIDPDRTDPAAIGHQFASLLMTARTAEGNH